MLVRLVLGLVVAGGAAAGGLALKHRLSRSYTPGTDRVPDELRPSQREAPGWAILAFTAPLCAACQRTPDVVAAALGVDRAALEDAPHGVAFDHVDVREHPDLVAHLAVDATPTVVVLDPSGAIRFAEQGNPDPARLADLLQPVLDADDRRAAAAAAGPTREVAT